MKADARTRILVAALELSASNGFEAMRTSDICARADVSNGSLFHFFPTKDAIGVALYRDGIAAYQAELLGALTTAPEPGAALRDTVRTQCRWAEAELHARFLFTYGRVIPPGPMATEIADLNARFTAALEHWRNLEAVKAALRPMPLAAFGAVLLGPSLMAIRAWLGMGGEPPSVFAEIFAAAAARSLLREADDA